MEVNRINPIGYCGGVFKAINDALKIKEKTNKKIYIFGQLVHNNVVSEFLEKKGIMTLEVPQNEKEKALEAIDSSSLVLFTAHGHKTKYEEILKKNNVEYLDLTCPNVTKNKELILKFSKERDVIYIGKKGHPETEGALDEKENVYLYDIKEGMDYSKIKTDAPLVINQTTLSIYEIKEIHDDIKAHFKNAIIYDEICNATRKRQENILNLDDDFDLLVVVGSLSSSNTDKLYLVAKNKFKDKMVIKVETLLDIKKYDLGKYKKAYITSGTSTPIESIEEIENYLKGV